MTADGNPAWSGTNTEEASPALFPGAPARKSIDDALTVQLLDACQRVSQGSVTPDFDAKVFEKELANFDFNAPRALTDVMSWSMAQLEHGIVHVTHPRYFGLFNPQPSFPSQCADRIASAFNPQLATATTSPAAVEIENHVIRAIGKKLGFVGATAGHFTSGGSEANATALLQALTNANARYKMEGVRAFSGEPVFYASRESHLAWVKIAQMAGLGRNGVRMVETDGKGQMDVAALASMIDGDRAAGRVPVMIAATAGTTAAGMFDPLEACATLAKRASLWFHVDAAWAGALIASSRHAGSLRGIEQADSVTIDAHKWFAASMGCGIAITRHPEALTEAFHVSAGYMPSQTASADPYMSTMQWSRRFLGLRLFLSLAAAGWDGYARHLERAIEQIDLLRDTMVARGWSVANSSPAAVLCLVPPGGAEHVRPIVQNVLKSGVAWVSVAQFERRDIVRVCVTNGETTTADVMKLADILGAEGAQQRAK